MVLQVSGSSSSRQNNNEAISNHNPLSSLGLGSIPCVLRFIIFPD
uniref:Uncharacterized protein n=1 Tax=Setaria viridis TaxID=4556 RepID=A0A4U6W7G3_SETVI|nr:hypothetical protein SEVIR_2G238650v2 [Setaria viridis]